MNQIHFYRINLGRIVQHRTEQNGTEHEVEVLEQCKQKNERKLDILRNQVLASRQK